MNQRSSESPSEETKLVSAFGEGRNLVERYPNGPPRIAKYGMVLFVVLLVAVALFSLRIIFGKQ